MKNLECAWVGFHIDGKNDITVEMEHISQNRARASGTNSIQEKLRKHATSILAFTFGQDNLAAPEMPPIQATELQIYHLCKSVS